MQRAGALGIHTATSLTSLRGISNRRKYKKPLAAELFSGCSRLVTNSGQGIVVASRFDDHLVRILENGGRVFFLPDGQKHSFDPMLMLRDTHDQKQVKTHGLVFETQVGSGRLLASALRHSGEQNAAGRWLLSEFVNHLRSGEPPRHALPNDVWAYLKSKLHAEQTNLVSCTWRFKPDPQNEGLARAWQNPSLASEADWKDIRIGTDWESQGYPALDGWVWCRLWVDVPEHWKSGDVYLSFEGVDDMYELYVNGMLAGKDGDLTSHKDALSEKKSHNITRLVTLGQNALIAVRVDDWVGAGGIFRPVTLGTLPFNPSLDLLK